MNRPVSSAEILSRTHLLRSSPESVHWGFFDGSLKPVLTINSGDRVVVECISGGPTSMPPESAGFQILPELLDVHGNTKQGTGNHILTGPIYVKGAEIGDVLEVRIIDIELRQDWGHNVFRAYGGTLPDDFPYFLNMHVRLDREAMVAI